MAVSKEMRDIGLIARLHLEKGYFQFSSALLENVLDSWRKLTGISEFLNRKIAEHYKRKSVNDSLLESLNIKYLREKDRLLEAFRDEHIKCSVFGPSKCLDTTENYSSVFEDVINEFGDYIQDIEFLEQMDSFRNAEEIGNGWFFSCKILTKCENIIEVTLYYDCMLFSFKSMPDGFCRFDNSGYLDNDHFRSLVSDAFVEAIDF